MNTNWTETIAADEDARFERIGEEMRGIQRARALKRPLGRSLHYKSHGGLRAELRTAEGLPEWARVGVFASPTTLPGYVRFSNGVGFAQRDATDDIRGMALKLVGVPGTKLIPGMEAAVTQDFLAIQVPTSALGVPEDFMALVRAGAGSPLLALPRLIGHFGFKRTMALLKSFQRGFAQKVTSVATRTFYSAVPIRWGAAAVKYSFAPRDAAQGDGSAPSTERDRLSLDLAARVAKSPLTYDLRVQPWVDEARTPIEDPSLEWLESVSPWVTVATLTIPKQDVTSEGGRKLAAWVEALSFDPWHAPEEFRPLGAMQRARKAAYKHSVIERKAAPEPDGSERWD